jgi:ribonuclease P protein component
VGLPSDHRLKNWQYFQKVYRQGKRYQSHHLIIKVLSPEDDQMIPTRFGISISKKVCKKAVTRNRLKRQIKAVIRTLLPQISPGWQIIIMVKPVINQCEYEHFLRELKELLLKAEVLYGN